MKNTKICKLHLPKAQEMINDKYNEINKPNQINLCATLCAISTFAWRSLESAWRLDAMVEKSPRNYPRDVTR